MKKNIRKTLWAVAAITIVIAIIGFKLWPSLGDKAASLEPSAMAAENPSRHSAGVPAALPAPGHPLFKKPDSANVSTIVAETPQANGVNGAPKTMKTDLGLVIPPLCFEQLFGVDGPKGPVDITACEKASGYKHIKTGIEEGRFRSVYEFPSEPDMPAEKGFSSYELLGQTPAGTVIQTYNEAGGTGRFSSVIIVRLNGNTLSLVDQITGGDRCNGGLSEAKVQDGKLTYSINITPGDFPTLAWASDKGLKAYEALEASAMSCFATATYMDGKFTSISLNPDAVKEAGDWENQYTHQKCFNEKFKAAIKAGHLEMTAAELKIFMDDFLASCPVKK
jgi:hypothetical protein